MSPDPPLSPLAARLAAVIANHLRTRVPLTDLRRAAHDADLSLPGHPDGRRRLRAVLDELAAAGLIRLPTGKAGWDHTIQPAMPAWVQRPSAPRTSARTSADAPIAWHAKLSWAARFVAQEHPTAAELAVLRAANAYLAEDRPRRVVPIRERSYELLDDEKALDVLSRGRLFTNIRLELADLYCERLPLPIASWPVRADRTGATLLVENHTTAHTLAGWLAPKGQIATVVYSAGSQLPQILAALPPDEHGPLCYFGDLDLRGIEIAADGDRHAQRLGLGPLRPVRGLYRLLLHAGRPQPAKSRLRSPAGPHVYDWLPTDLRDEIIETINRGNRIAQEALGLDVLAGQAIAAFDPL